MPKNPQTDASVLSLIRLLFSTKSTFSGVFSQTFQTISHIQRPFTVLLQRAGNTCTFHASISSSCQHDGVINYQHRIPSNFVSNIFLIIALHVGRIVVKTCRPKMFLVKDVLKICSKFTGEHPCRSVISIKLQSSFIEITLRYGCSPVNLLHPFTTPFSLVHRCVAAASVFLK